MPAEIYKKIVEEAFTTIKTVGELLKLLSVLTCTVEKAD